MIVQRRSVLIAGAGAAALVALPASLAMAQPAPEAGAADEVIAKFTGGAEAAQSDALKLTAPEIAENGNTVPISVEAEGATEILLVATGNPTPGVAVFRFGELASKPSASTRIRLASTQDVIAVAKMADGSFARNSANVKVTIGGCGG